MKIAKDERQPFTYRESNPSTVRVLAGTRAEEESVAADASPQD